MSEHIDRDPTADTPEIGRRERRWLIAALAAMAGAAAWLGYATAGGPLLVVATLTVLAFGGAVLVVIRRHSAAAERAVHSARQMFEALNSRRNAVLIESAENHAVFMNQAFRELVAGFGVPPERIDAGDGLPGWLDAVGVPAEITARLREMAGCEHAAHHILDLSADNGGGRYEIAVRRLSDSSLVWRIHRLAGDWSALRRGWRARAEAHAEAIPVGLYTLDGAGRFLYVNPAMAGWIGMPTGEILESGLTMRDVTVADADLDPLRPGLNVLTLKSADGRVQELQVAHTVLETDDGPVIHGIGRLVGPAGGGAQRFKELFREMPVGVALVDRRLRIGDCNTAFEALVDDPEPVSKPILDFLVDDEKVSVATEFQAVLDGRSPAKSLEVGFKGEGEAVASIFVGRLQDDHGNPAGLVLLVVDTTEQKNLEAQLVQSQKMQAVGQLAGGIAHDFNNVLTAMIGFCDLLLQRHRPGDQSFADIMQIKQNANRAAALVRQLLAFSRQQTLQPRLLNVTEVLAELSNLLRRLLGEKIELSMVHGRDLGLVKGDQGQLEQVIINLAVNARDAMTSGGLLTVLTGNAEVDRPRQAHGEVMPAGNYVHISVKDTGTGIPKENFARIFEPFFTTKEVGSGTGLGLSTVYGIVKQTGGYLFVDSDGDGAGTVFDIYFPSQEAGAVEPASTDSSEIAADLTGGGTVLLVEDEDPVRLFSARALRNKGYKVVEAKTGEAALELLNGGPFDLLVTDMVMPRVDGAQVISAARGKIPDLPVICISGYTEESVLKEVESLDNLRFLSKPFSLKQLAAAVKEQLASAETRRARADA